MTGKVLIVVLLALLLLVAVVVADNALDEMVYVPVVKNAEATPTRGPDATPDWTPWPTATPNDPTATPDF